MFHRLNVLFYFVLFEHKFATHRLMMPPEISEMRRSLIHHLWSTSRNPVNLNTDWTLQYCVKQIYPEVEFLIEIEYFGFHRTKSVTVSLVL